MVVQDTGSDIVDEGYDGAMDILEENWQLTLEACKGELELCDMLPCELATADPDAMPMLEPFAAEGAMTIESLFD